MPDTAPGHFRALLAALTAEPDPPTTITDPAAALDRHVADSLTGLHFPGLRRATTIADVGAGAGFPGLPLAIALPTAQMDLIESSRRKCEVIARLAASSGIHNAEAIHARVEEWAAKDGREAYDAVTARALAPLAVLVEYAAPLLTRGGLLIAWKGTRDAAEEKAGAQAAEIVGLHPTDILQVRPFQGSNPRHLHTYVKQAPTPTRFPRRPGMATKRPLAG